MFKYLFGTFLISFSAFDCFAQGELKPKTKLEQFSLQSGFAVVQGYTNLGLIEGLNSTATIIKCKEFFSPTNGKKEYGITVEVIESGRGGSNSSIAYVDYDEIATLIKGIDFVAKVDRSSTKLENYQADYITKGDLRITKFVAEGDKSVLMSIQSGIIRPIAASYKLSDFTKVRDLIVKAKEKLDSIK